MKKIFSVLLLVFVLFLSGCGYGELEGKIIDKEHQKRKTILQPRYMGKGWMMMPVVYPEKWSLKLEKQENRRNKNNLDNSNRRIL